MENRISTLAAMIAVLGGLIVAYMNCANPPPAGVVKGSQVTPLAACGDQPFTVPPVDLGKVKSVVPLGSYDPNRQIFPSPRLKFSLVEDAGKPVTANLVSPGEIRVTSLVRVQNLSTNPVETEFEVVFQPCQDLEGVFARVQSLRAELMNLAGDFDSGTCVEATTGGQNFRRCSKALVAEFSANATMGVVGGRSQASFFELGLRDARAPDLVFAKPERIDRFASRFDDFHTVCPLNYFVTGLRGEMELKLGNLAGTETRTLDPLCGTSAQDVPGKAMGRWYKPATPLLPQDPHLHLGVDPIHPDRGAFTFGESVPGLSGVLSYTVSTDLSSRRNLSTNQISSDGQVYCFDAFSGGGTVLLQMASAEELRIQKGPNGNCGSAPYAFSGTPVSFVR